MFKMFRQKKTLWERKLALVSQIKQLRNEIIRPDALIRFPDLSLKEGLLQYDDSTKQTN